MKKQLSVIIPCFNEANIISDTVKAVDRYLRIRKYEYEIIIVDDGSTDRTLYVVSALVRQYKNLYFTGYDKNKGKGYAVRKGLILARYRTKLVLDADLSVDISELYKIENSGVSGVFLEGYDLFEKYIIKGQRKQIKKQPLHRIIAGKVFKIIVWLFTGIYMDTQCPFFVSSLPKSFYQDLKINGFSFDVEILYKAKLQNIRIDKIEVSYYNDKDSSVRLRHYFQMFKELIKIRIKK
jgi:dolichyl-phosphate beta-glucosyltransferase